MLRLWTVTLITKTVSGLYRADKPETGLDEHSSEYIISSSMLQTTYYYHRPIIVIIISVVITVTPLLHCFIVI